MNSRVPLLVVSSLLALTIGSQAFAAKLRLSMDTSLFHFSKDKYDFSDGGYTYKESITSFGIGGGGYTLSDDSSQSGSLFRLGIGGVLMNHLIIGIDFGLAMARVMLKEEEEDDDDDDKFGMFGFNVMPYISYKFGEGVVQPFVTATFGYDGAILKYEDDSYSYKVMAHQFALAGGGGIHIFPAESFSFDLSAMMGGAFGKLVVKEKEDDYEEEKDKYPITSLNFNIFVGISGWI